MSEKKQFQIEAKFNEKLSEEERLGKLLWAMEFISNLDDGKAGGRTGEKIKSPSSRCGGRKKAIALSANLPAGLIWPIDLGGRPL